MTPRAFQLVQNVLITAVAVVVALAVWAAFQRVIEPPDPALVAANEAQRAAVTAGVEFPGAPVTSGPPDQAPPPQEAAPSTSIVTGPECREDPPETGSGTVLRVYYTCGPSPVPTADFFVYRVVPQTELVLTATLTELVKGPEPNEKEAGFISFFSSDTTDALTDLSLNDGRVTIDFNGLEEVNNLTTSSGSEFFLANLNANVFQFDTIDAAEYRLNGSCDEFWNLLQRDCQLVTRAEWNRQLAVWRNQG